MKYKIKSINGEYYAFTKILGIWCHINIFGKSNWFTITCPDYTEEDSKKRIQLHQNDNNIRNKSRKDSRR